MRLRPLVCAALLVFCSTAGEFLFDRAIHRDSEHGNAVVGGTAMRGAAFAASTDLLRAGPMATCTTHRSTVIWLQAERPAEARLRVSPQADSKAALTLGPARTADDGIATFELADLEPGITYVYELWLDGKRVERAKPFTVTTQPLWQWRTDPPAFTALIGSCAYINDPPYDRPGNPYGGEHEIFAAMAAQSYDVMVWLGDNVYYREVDWNAPSGLLYRNRHDRALPLLQDLFAHGSHFAMWDDHDYGPNDSDASYSLKGAALEVFARYWPAVQYGTPETAGAFQRFTWADVDFFLLDDRYHRMPNRWPDGPDKTMLGAGQLEWLKQGLLSSGATFKVVACGNQVLNPISQHESMGQFAADRTAILEWIRDRKVEGVFFLSGDRHHTELLRIEQPGCYPLFDYTSSPLTSGAHQIKDDDPEFRNPSRVEGTLLMERNFGSLTFQGPKKERTVTLRAHDRAGVMRWEHTLTRSELGFAK